MKILVLDDGIQGNTNQSLGVAEALQQSFDIFQVQFGGISYRLPGRKGKTKLIPKIAGLLLRFGAYKCAYALCKFSSITDLPENNYDIVISAGSFLAPLNLVISKKINSKSICIMTPEGVPLKEFDLLIVPYHDSLRYPILENLGNVFFTIGAPNRINPSLLERSKRKLAVEICIPEKSIKVGIIIGGSDQNYIVDVDWTKKLFAHINKLSAAGFVFLLTTSRRTPFDVVNFVIENANTSNFVYTEFPGTKQGSHYFGMLAICDILLVSEDSITMVSEACSTGKAVIVLGVKRRKKRKPVFDATIARLVKDGYCYYIDGDSLDKIPEMLKKALETKSFPSLNESRKCAEKIIELMRPAGY